MRTKDLIDLAGDPNFISGIYNYCDRWCERCPLTSRCFLYATENRDAEDSATHDITNAEFWYRLDEVFRQTQEMLTPLAQERGIDLSTISDESINDSRNGVDEARKNELSLAAENYAITIDKWFAERMPEVEGTAALCPSESGETEAVEVIRWYQLQIATKIVRGLIALDDEPEDDVDEFSCDSNGSIKVALLGIQRSIGAWRGLQMARLDLVEAINPILLTLETLRCDLEQAYPRAMDFIRPGFDEIEGIN